MMWWWTWLGCHFQVDFDPDATPSGSGTGDSGQATTAGPSLLFGTNCSATSDDWSFDVDASWKPEPLDRATTSLVGVDVAHLEFVLLPGSMEVRVGDVAAPQIEFDASGGMTLLHQVDGDRLFVAGGCKPIGCRSSHVTITLPEAADTVVGHTATDAIDVIDAARTDVLVSSWSGDVRVTGSTAGIRARTLDGDVHVVAPQGQVVDLHAPSGAISFEGAARTELCAFTGLGALEATIERANLVRLESSTGDITASFASRVPRTKVETVSGTTSLSVPAGAYDLQFVVLVPDGLTLENVTDDPTSKDRIEGYSVSGEVELTGH